MQTARMEERRDARQCAACGHRFSPDAAFCPFDGSPLVAASFDPLADPLLGVTIDGRYEPLEVIGEGGMGRVYRVRHVALERAFAMKVLRRELAVDDELAKRFVQEAKATAAIKHPNIVEITDFGMLAATIPYFVMELLVGQTLRSALRHGPMPKARALPIFEQLANGLGAAHHAGVIHRDLKPDNVFLTGSGESAQSARLVDFGASKIVGVSRMTRDGIVFGTPHYMSPEQAAGQEVDSRADIYSFGVIMYEALTGLRPFEAETYMGVLRAHMFQRPVAPTEANRSVTDLGSLEEVILRCLAKAPEDRFATMKDVVGALERAAAESMAAGPTSGTMRHGEHRPAPTTAAGASTSDALAAGSFDASSLPRHPVPWKPIAAAIAAAASIAGGVIGIARIVSDRPPNAAGATVATAPSGIAGPRAASGGVKGSGATRAPEAAPNRPVASADAKEPEPSGSSAPEGASAAAPPRAAVQTAGSSAPRRRIDSPRPDRRRSPAPLDDVGDPFAARR